MIADHGFRRKRALVIDTLHPIEDAAARAVVEVESAEVDDQIMKVVGEGEAHRAILSIEVVAALSDVRRKQVTVHLDVRNEEVMAYLWMNLVRVEDGDALLASEDEGVGIAACGAAFIELVTLHTIVLVIGMETSRCGVEARKAVEGAYPDVACRSIDCDARDVGAHVRSMEVANFACSEVEAEYAHADGCYPDSPVAVLSHIAAADHALLVARQVEMCFGKGVGVDDGDARTIRTCQNTSVAEFVDDVDLPQIVINEGRSAVLKVDDAATRLCADPDALARVFGDGIDFVVGRKVM